MAQIGLGIAGLGRGAILTVPGLAAHPEIALVAGFDPSIDARTGFAQSYGATTHDSFEALLADPAVDAVYIASPHEYHAEQAIAAARAGKHALVEKPMAVNLADAQAMVVAAAQSGTCLMIGPSHGYDGPVALAADVIAQGELGRPRMIQAFNYTDFLFRPRRPEELDRDQGGGVLFSQATHQIDMVRRLVGGPVRSVRARLFDWDKERPSDGAFSAMLFFENGATASLTYSGYAHYDSDALYGWIGEMGRAKAPDTHAQARRRLAGLDEAAQKRRRGFGSAAAKADVQPTAHEHFGFVLASCAQGDLELTPQGVTVHRNASTETLTVPVPDVLRSGIGDALVASMANGAPALFDGEWGLHSLACCHAIQRSSHEDREVSITEILSESC